jgi:protease-4
VAISRATALIPKVDMRCALLAAASLFLLPNVAHAQVPDLPGTQWHGPTIGDGGFAVAANPATLAFTDGASTTFAAARDVDTGRTEYGFGFVLGGGGFGGIGAIGAGGYGFDAGVDADGRAIRGTAGTFALAMGSPMASFGWARDFFDSDDSRALDNFASSRLGVAFRPLNVLGFSGWLANPGTPRFAGEPVARRWGVGAATRTADGRFEFDAAFDAQIDELEHGRATGLVRARLVDGVLLAASVGVDRTRGENDVFGLAGIELSIGPMTVAPGARLSQGDGADQIDSLLWAAIDVPTRPSVMGDRNRLLRIDISGAIPERGSSRFGAGHYPGITDIVATLDRMAREDIMGGVFIRSSGLNAGTTQLVDLCDALDRLRASGRKVVVYFDSMTIRDLYLAAHADVAFVSPTVSVLETGIGSTRIYLADLLARLGVEAQFVRIGEFKSAPERFTNSGPSEASSAQLGAYLDVLFDELLAGIAAGLGSEPAAAAALLDRAPLDADDLVDAGLIDEAVYPDEIARHLRAELGDSYSVVSEMGGIAERDRTWLDRDVIAVLHVDGSITAEAMLFGGGTAADRFVETCEALIDDRDIDGVVLRIDSPGGSAIASDNMQRCLGRLADERPVVVSMGGVAASGGYYVAAIDAPIHATRTTLTGSIGIYAGTFALDGLLARFGVNRVRDERGGPSEYFDGIAWSDETEQRVFESISDFYDRFLDKVAAARGMTTEEVDAVARGRIWAGQAAFDAGLVDHLDGVQGALDAIRVEAGIPAHRPLVLRHYPEAEFSLRSLATGLLTGASEPVTIAETLDVLGLGELAAYTEELAAHGDLTPVARIEWFFDAAP